MQLGMVGLGRMGANLVHRLVAAGHECVVYDQDRSAVDALSGPGIIGIEDLAGFGPALEPPRAVWIMVPAAVTGTVVENVSRHLSAGDVVIDGGNSYYQDSVRQAAHLAEAGLIGLDVGTSGGVFGLERGFSLMIGGDQAAVDRLSPIFSALAPGVEAAERTRNRTGEPAPEEEGWLHCGPAGAGHFVKMVHNGIEYGMMAAYAEGMNIIRHAGAGRDNREADAETAPMADPEMYQYQLDPVAISEVWRRGSVISSWLADLTAAALHDDPALEGFSGHVSDSGEGRWTVLTAIEEGVPAPVISSALYSRFASRGRDDFANRVLSAMRQEFGGHREKR